MKSLFLLKAISLSLIDRDKFHIENQSGIRRDHAARAAFPVSKFWRDDQLCLAANLHQRDAFVPAFDHAPGAKRKCDWLAARNRTVKDLAILKLPSVMHTDHLTCLCLRAGTGLHFDVFQSA